MRSFVNHLRSQEEKRVQVVGAQRHSVRSGPGCECIALALLIHEAAVTLKLPFARDEERKLRPAVNPGLEACKGRHRESYST